MRKSSKKVECFCRIAVISEIFPYCPTAQTVEFVAYRATVYSNGVCNIMHLHVKDAKLPLQSTYITPMSHDFATKICYSM